LPLPVPCGRPAPRGEAGGRQEIGREESQVVAHRIRQRIQLGQQALRRMRLRLAASMFFLALATAWLQLLLERLCADRVCEQAGCFGREDAAAWFLEFAVALAFYFRFIFLGLAPLVDSPWLTRAVLLTDCGVLVLDLFIADRAGRHPELPKGVPGNLTLYTHGPLTVFFLASALRASTLKECLRIQNSMWHTLSTWCVLNIALEFAFAVLRMPWFEGRAILRETARTNISWVWMLAPLPTLFVSSQSRLRRSLQVWLMRRCEAKAYRLAAVGIAGLVGDCSSEQALATARARFRAIDLAKLGAEDLADNRPNPALYERSEPARLSSPGICDAFISHSWHDDAPAKWSALQGWRAKFVAKSGREPRVWFDKCCVDQTNIDLDLRCLPVFLSGCQTMVVLCGPSYLSRLWCIMEIFTYVHMGHDLGRIEIIPVLREGKEVEDRAEVEHSFHAFDANNCTCVRNEDRERLLRIILAAYGSLRRFGTALREIFAEVGMPASADPA